jgi:myo-inositol-1(or 4)-monophosphatase
LYTFVGVMWNGKRQKSVLQLPASLQLMLHLFYIFLFGSFDKSVLLAAKELSTRIIQEAGQIVKDRFDNLNGLEEKGEFGDVVTEVDFLAESIILKEINKVFPLHQVHSEEAGSNHLESDWLWLIDPLDGTNNYAIGLSVFAVSITLMFQRKPVLGVVFEPMANRLFVSTWNEKAYCNDIAIQVKKRVDLKKGDIGWIQGHKVQKNVRAAKLRHHLEDNFKRTLRLWEPTVQWCMLAKGDIDGIVLYNSEGDDLYSGVLMVKEAGGIVIDFHGNPFNEMCEEPYLIACHPEHKDYFLKVVREGLE